jgi:predicted O-linked N-acetylglucosamine transferase (SPINDLY family)
MVDRHDDEEWQMRLAEAASALQSGDMAGAIRIYNEYIERNSQRAEAFYKRAVAYSALSRIELALADYDRAIALKPDYAYAHCNRGSILERMGRKEEALRSYDAALAIDRTDFLAHYNRGTVLEQLGRLHEAVIAFDYALVLKPDYAEAYVNRGNVLQALGRHAQAVDSFNKSVELKPVVEAFLGLSTSLVTLGQLEAAISAIGRALKFNPDQKAVLGARRQIQMQICDWAGLDEDLQQITEGLMRGDGVCAPHATLALVDSSQLQRLAAEIWMRGQCPPSDALGPIPARLVKRKTRIGYFSADFRDHAVSLLTAELFELHDRTRFEITAFAFGPESHGAVRVRLEHAFDRFIDVSAQSDVEVASLARQLEIDIAVDLGGYTQYCRTRIFAMRAAPIQVSYLGYLGTMAAPYIDYLLADATIMLDSERHNYTEKIVYLPSYQVNDSTRSVGSRFFTRSELGIAPVGFVFSCFNANYKIMPATFSIWMRILKRVADSCLFIYVDNELAERNLQQAARQHGVRPDRLVFGKRLSREDYSARLRVMDLFLDTLPYNAGTTASDALWAGLPVLTCAGRSFASRVAASLLRSIGLPELITSTAQEYEDLAVDLAMNPERLESLKVRLSRNRSSAALFDTPTFTRHLETAYTMMLERDQKGLKPDHIYVNP